MSTSRQSLRLRHEDAEIALELDIGNTAEAPLAPPDPASVYRSIMDSPWLGNTPLSACLQGGQHYDWEFRDGLDGPWIIWSFTLKSPERKHKRHAAALRRALDLLLGGPDLACPRCQQRFPASALLRAASGYARATDSGSSTCPCCDRNLEFRLRTGAIELGYTYAAGAAHFDAVSTHPARGLRITTSAHELIATLDDQCFAIRYSDPDRAERASTRARE